MKYLEVYNQICDSRKSMEDERVILKESGEYFERHHIKPRCTGSNNSNDNLALLTAREHFIVHALLYRVVCSNEVPGKVKRDLIFSFVLMKGISRGPTSEKTKNKLSLIMKGRVAIKHTDAAKQKMSESAKNEKRVECPHYHNQFRASHAKRWHFDNCKQKGA